MSDLELREQRHDRLTLEPSLGDGKLEVCLRGVCDSFAANGLGAYLEQVTREVLRLGLGNVAINVTHLRLINSSSIRQLVVFLRPIKLGTFRCAVEFLVDDRIPWQRRCVAALARLCPTAVSVRGVSGSPNA